MSAFDVYDCVVEHVSDFLVRQGFARRKKRRYVSWIRDVSGNSQIVSLQKSGYSRAQSVYFDFIVGVASGRILSFFGEPVPFGATGSHWHSYLRHAVLGQGGWWEVLEHDDALKIVSDVIEALRIALPKVAILAKDEGLRDFWLSWKENELGVDRLCCLSLLLLELGPREKLSSVLSALQTAMTDISPARQKVSPQLLGSRQHDFDEFVAKLRDHGRQIGYELEYEQ